MESYFFQKLQCIKDIHSDFRKTKALFKKMGEMFKFFSEEIRVNIPEDNFSVNDSLIKQLNMNIGDNLKDQADFYVQQADQLEKQHKILKFFGKGLKILAKTAQESKKEAIAIEKTMKKGKKLIQDLHDYMDSYIRDMKVAENSNVTTFENYLKGEKEEAYVEKIGQIETILLKLNREIHQQQKQSEQQILNAKKMLKNVFVSHPFIKILDEIKEMKPLQEEMSISEVLKGYEDFKLSPKHEKKFVKIIEDHQ